MPLAEQIAAAAHQVLEKTPPELAGDIYTDGVMLTGGGAMLKGAGRIPGPAAQGEGEGCARPHQLRCPGHRPLPGHWRGLESGFQDATPRLGRR